MRWVVSYAAEDGELHAAIEADNEAEAITWADERVYPLAAAMDQMPPVLGDVVLIGD